MVDLSAPVTTEHHAEQIDFNSEPFTEYNFVHPRWYRSTLIKVQR